MNFSFLNETDRQVIQKSGYGARRGFGQRAALLIIDAQNKFLGPDLPVVEAIEEHPLAIGSAAHRAIEKIRILQKAARASGMPILYTVNVLAPNETVFNSFAKKRPSYEKDGVIDTHAEEICDPVAPAQNEWIIHKRYASAFFGTPLLSYLNALKCDTLIVTGFSTSGCVRACCVDAASYNLHPVVAEDAVADRLEYAHRGALLDLYMKYADVLTTEEICSCMDESGRMAKKGE